MDDTYAIVLSGGGERVIPYHRAALTALPGAALLIGTSAGAFVAAGGAAKAPALRENGGPPGFDRLAAVWTATPGTDTDRRRAIGAAALAHGGDEDAFVARVARGLPDGPWPHALRIVTVDAETGERVVLTAADGVPLARAVAASRSIPTIDPPVTVNGRRCIDGAVGSATNADLALGTEAETVVISAPVSESLWVRALDREIHALEAAGRRVRRIPPR
jgi:NTE family protein